MHIGAADADHRPSIYNIPLFFEDPARSTTAAETTPAKGGGASARGTGNSHRMHAASPFSAVTEPLSAAVARVSAAVMQGKGGNVANSDATVLMSVRGVHRQASSLVRKGSTSITSLGLWMGRRVSTALGGSGRNNSVSGGDLGRRSDEQAVELSTQVSSSTLISGAATIEAPARATGSFCAVKEQPDRSNSAFSAVKEEPARSNVSFSAVNEGQQQQQPLLPFTVPGSETPLPLPPPPPPPASSSSFSMLGRLLGRSGGSGRAGEGAGGSGRAAGAPPLLSLSSNRRSLAAVGPSSSMTTAQGAQGALTSHPSEAAAGGSAGGGGSGSDGTIGSIRIRINSLQLTLPGVFFFMVFK